MATRFYLPASGSVDITPSYDTQWNNTLSAARAPLVTSKSSTSHTEVARSETSGSRQYMLFRQYVSAPLNAQTISGTVTITIRGRESSVSANAFIHSVIRVIAPDGSTVRGTLYSPGLSAANTTPGAFGHEFQQTTTVGAGEVRYIDAASLTSVSAQAGDYLVVELGAQLANTSTSGMTAGMTFGDTASSDLPTTTTYTTDDAPWVEFSANISFQSSTSEGSATGSWSASGSASGSQPVQGIGSATGSWSAAGTNSGTRTSSGTSTGAWSFSGSATGSTPAAYIGNDTASTDVTVPGNAVSGTFLGQRFTTTITFDKVAAQLPTYGSSTTDVRIRLYKDVDLSGNGTLVKSVDITDHPDNGWAELTLDSSESGSGTYEIRVYELSGTLGWWHNTSNVFADGQASSGDSSSYTSGSSSSGDRVFRVYYATAAQKSGSGSGSFSFSGSAAGAVAHSGSSTGAFSFTGTGTGEQPTGGSSTGTWNVSGSASGARQSTGSVSAPFTVTGSSNGVRESAGQATGSFSFAGDASGARASAGSTSGTWAVTGVAVGEFVAAGSASGASAWSASATGEMPLEVRSGAGTASQVSLDSACAGTKSTSAAGASQGVGLFLRYNYVSIDGLHIYGGLKRHSAQVSTAVSLTSSSTGNHYVAISGNEDGATLETASYVGQNITAVRSFDAVGIKVWNNQGPQTIDLYLYQDHFGSTTLVASYSETVPNTSGQWVEFTFDALPAGNYHLTTGSNSLLNWLSDASGTNDYTGGVPTWRSGGVWVADTGAGDRTLRVFELSDDRDGSGSSTGLSLSSTAAGTKGTSGTGDQTSVSAVQDSTGTKSTSASGSVYTVVVETTGNGGLSQSRAGNPLVVSASNSVGDGFKGGDGETVPDAVLVTNSTASGSKAWSGSLSAILEVTGFSTGTKSTSGTGQQTGTSASVTVVGYKDVALAGTSQVVVVIPSRRALGYDPDRASDVHYRTRGVQSAWYLGTLRTFHK